MKTCELRKGARVVMRNGFYGTMMDNQVSRKIRSIKVEGLFTDIGDNYTYDIAYAIVDNKRVPIEHTQAEVDQRSFVRKALRR